MSLKIIALKVGKGNKPYILKNLKAEHWYIFDNDYEIINNKPEHKKKASIPDDFFSIKNDKQSPDINIHTIVGKNGSGKSAVIDFLLRLINNYACALLGDYNTENRGGGDLCWVDGVQGEFHFSLEDKINSIVQKKDKTIFFNNERVPIETKNDRFFYTVLLNYSIYAFNKNDYRDEFQGKHHWLDGLFHKNDGYQTPIVLNPKRDDGNFDINTKNELTVARLISLFFIDSGENTNPFTKLNDRYNVSKVTIKQKKNELGSRESSNKSYSEKIYHYLKEKSIYKNNEKEITQSDIESIEREWEKVFEELDIKISNNQLRHAFAYLIYKTIAIAVKYPNQFASTRTLKFNHIQWGSLIEELKNDRSHVTNKLHQTLNYLLGAHKSNVYKGIGGKSKKDICINDFSSIDVSEVYKNKDKIYRIPPPIFSLEIYVKENNNEYPISQLSSGEKQLVYTIAGILYHIRNVNSVPKNNSSLIKYRHINLVLDEIELYFHPEYQRRFIYQLMRSIRQMNFSDIESVNILLATHSPFILSDIPKSKILFLDNGETASGVQEQTFGANIHTMLKHSFFIEGMPIGDFAREKIQLLLESIEEGRESYDDLLDQINIIGEPIIRRELKRKLDEKNDVLHRIKKLEEELTILKEQNNTYDQNKSPQS